MLAGVWVKPDNVVNNRAVMTGSETCGMATRATGKPPSASPTKLPNSLFFNFIYTNKGRRNFVSRRATTTKSPDDLTQSMGDWNGGIFGLILIVGTGKPRPL
jgi:hypothetical protein